MLITRDSVFLLTSSETERKKAFGTGFALAYKEQKLFILTCAHVVERLDGKVRICGCNAEIVSKGSGDIIDLALLSIPCDKKDVPPLLNRIGQGKANKAFRVYGYSLFTGSQYVFRELKGRLGKSIAFTSTIDHRFIEGWDICIEDDNFSKLQGGYSGSPLCDEEGNLVAVVSHRIADGQYGHAIALCNLKIIYPDIEELIPSDANNKWKDSQPVELQNTNSHPASRSLEEKISKIISPVKKSEKYDGPRRLPLYILVNCSKSMEGEPIQAAMNGIKVMVSTLHNDPYILETLWVSIIVFANGAWQVTPLTDLVSFNVYELFTDISNESKLGAAFELLNNAINREVIPTTWDRRGDFRPIVIVLTDRNPTDRWVSTANALLKKKRHRIELVIYCVGTEIEPDIFSIIPNVKIFHNDTVSSGEIKSIFQWISQSVAR
ncbi:MAG: VWA domain-containing protein [Candidatus Electrothrix sp. AX5]|nr:VWA domain-containing protein [Candidatus Electrothrix sp. AX5]